MADEQQPNRNAWWQGIFTNIFDPKNIGGFITIVFIAALFAILGRAIFDDKFLTSLGRVEVARGLITSLISIGVVGIAVVIILANYTSGQETNENHDLLQEKFNRGKDILAILVGILGTIVGFYFGSTNLTGQCEVLGKSTSLLGFQPPTPFYPLPDSQSLKPFQCKAFRHFIKMSDRELRTLQ